MKIYEQVESFIKQNIDLINQGDKDAWEKIYDRAKGELDIYVGELTQMFLDSGIDPLIYLSYIPSFYMHSNTYLKNFTIPNNINFIGGAAFSGCSKLKEIIIPDNVTNIDYRAFRNCHDLKKASFHCTEIGGEAFMDSGLEEIYISNNVKEILPRAFYNCYYLTEIIYEGTPEQFKKIGIRSNIFGTDTNQYIQRYITYTKTGERNNLKLHYTI